MIVLVAACVSSANADIVVDNIRDGVVMHRAAEGDWAPLKKGDVLGPGMEIKTLEKAYILVSHSKGIFWTLHGGVLALEPAESKTGAPGIVLKSGVMALNLEKTEGAPLNLDVGYESMKVHSGAGVFSISSDLKSGLEAVAGEGEICLETSEGNKVSECVRSGWTIGWDPVKKTFRKSQKISSAAYLLWKNLGWNVSRKNPDLSIVRPADGKYFNSSSITVSGTTTPGCIVRVNSSEIPVNDNGSFSGSISLYEGENKLVIEARSPSGGVAAVTRSVFLDSVPPILTISQPSDNFDMTLTGRCDGRHCYVQIFGLTEPGVSLQINGVDASRHIEDDGSFLIDDFPMRLEEKTLTIEVVDNLGQRAVEILYAAEPMDSDFDGVPDMMDMCPLDPDCQ